jgi:hypothetical protein
MAMTMQGTQDDRKKRERTEGALKCEAGEGTGEIVDGIMYHE